MLSCLCIQKGGFIKLMCISLFYRLVQEIAQDFKTKLCFMGSTLLALQYASEGFLVDVFSKANLAPMHVKWVMIQSKDIHVVKEITRDFVWHVSWMGWMVNMARVNGETGVEWWVSTGLNGEPVRGWMVSLHEADWGSFRQEVVSVCLQKCGKCKGWVIWSWKSV